MQCALCTIVVHRKLAIPPKLPRKPKPASDANPLNLDGYYGEVTNDPAQNNDQREPAQVTATKKRKARTTNKATKRAKPDTESPPLHGPPSKRRKRTKGRVSSTGYYGPTSPHARQIDNKEEKRRLFKERHSQLDKEQRKQKEKRRKLEQEEKDLENQGPTWQQQTRSEQQRINDNFRQPDVTAAVNAALNRRDSTQSQLLQTLLEKVTNIEEGRKASTVRSLGNPLFAAEYQQQVHERGLMLEEVDLEQLGAKHSQRGATRMSLLSTACVAKEDGAFTVMSAAAIKAVQPTRMMKSLQHLTNYKYDMRKKKGKNKKGSNGKSVRDTCVDICLSLVHT